MLTHVIDPDSAVPPYEQVAKMLRDEIAEGTLIGRIPSIHTIAEHHHVSHRTAARALSILKGEGMIVSVPSHGHFVRKPQALPSGRAPVGRRTSAGDQLNGQFLAQRADPLRAQ